MDSTKAPSVVREKLLEEWITRYGNAVLRTCYVCLSDASLAQDAMQDTFLKAWRAMDKFEGRNDCKEKTWLMRIAMNVCGDYRRTKWFKHVDMRKSLDEMPERASEEREDNELLQDILLLPVKYRQVILMYYYHEMTMQETADALNISRSSVFHRLEKAREALKKTLTGREQG